MKNRKIIVCLVIILLLISCMSVSFAAIINPVEAMKGMGQDTTNESLDSVANSLGPVINTAIGLIQMVGTGLSLVMVSILGIKYMMAAPNDKAEVKKQITPMVVGCAILFASVNIVQIIANFTEETLK